MNKKHFAKFRIKDKVLKNELTRAHGMIILLVVTLMAVLAMVSNGIIFDPSLTFIATILLALVGLLSLSVFASLVMKRK
jgi:hypothetical protein